MRVLTFNIRGWRTQAGQPNFAAVAKLIAATQADIVGLNEVYYPRAREGTAGPALKTLAAQLGMHFVFGPCLRWPAQDNLPADAYGNALLSRWPILASAAHHLTPVAGREQRGLLEARIALAEGHPFTVYVTHLDHNDEAARLIQLRALRTWTVRDRNRPHLVMGDFNAITPWDYADRPEALTRLTRHAKGQNLVNAASGGPQVIPQMEKAGYVDAFARVGAPGAQSYLNITEPPIRIDYIFLSQSLVPALIDCQVWVEDPGTEASDHRPILADFDLSRLTP